KTCGIGERSPASARRWPSRWSRAPASGEPMSAGFTSGAAPNSLPNILIRCINFVVPQFRIGSRFGLFKARHFTFFVRNPSEASPESEKRQFCQAIGLHRHGACLTRFGASRSPRRRTSEPWMCGMKLEERKRKAAPAVPVELGKAETG